MFNQESANKIYEHVNPDWLFTSGGLKIPLNPSWKRIAINLSGGADSALGASILAKHIRDNNLDIQIVVVTHVRVWTTRPWAGAVSKEVFAKLQEMWGTDIIVERIQNFIPPEIEEANAGPNLVEGRSGDRVSVDSFNRYVTNQYQIDAAYNFVTLNPQTDLKETLGFDNIGRQPHDRNQTAEQAMADPAEDWRIAEGVSTNMNPHYGTSWLIQPWKYVEKDWVIAQYKLNGWMDLLHTTRSCEVDAGLEVRGETLEDYKTYVHGTSPLWECEDHCFWCAERNWAKASAADKLNIDVSEFKK
jgi:hypothetical protein